MKEEGIQMARSQKATPEIQATLTTTLNEKLEALLSGSGNAKNRTHELRAIARALEFVEALGVAALAGSGAVPSKTAETPLFAKKDKPKPPARARAAAAPSKRNAASPVLPIVRAEPATGV